MEEPGYFEYTNKEQIIELLENINDAKFLRNVFFVLLTYVIKREERAWTTLKRS